MYKRPPKHIQRARLAVLYSIMTVVVLGVVAMMVLIVSNYRYDRTTGTFEQRGLVQFASTPSGATIEVDDRVLSSRTSAKSSVEAGERRFAIWRDGYQAWNLTTTIEPGDLTWLNYIRLVPNERPVETLRHYPSVDDSLAAPTKRAVLVLPNRNEPVLRLIDISGSSPTGSMLELPAGVYETAEAGDKPAPLRVSGVAYSLDHWSENGRYVTMWRHQGDQRELIVVDVRDPSRTVNVSREFSLTINQAFLSGRSGNVFYIISGGSLRKLNVSDGTVTRSLVGQVAQASLFEDNTVAYVTQPDSQTGERQAGVYREGDRDPALLRTVQDPEVPLAIAISQYYDTSYTAIAEGNKVDIYSGHYDEGAESLNLIASHTIQEPVDSIEFNETGSFVLIRAGKTFASYGVERDILSQHELGSGSSKDLFWLDSMHLGLVANDVLTMRDIDGSNIFELNAAVNQAATLSRNGTYLYSFGQAENGDVVSQRIRMILP